MLDARGHVKLIDFGLAAEISKPEEPVSPIGSLIYMAPELLTKGNNRRTSAGERVLPTQVEKCILFFFGIEINSPARHSYKKTLPHSRESKQGRVGAIRTGGLSACWPMK